MKVGFYAHACKLSLHATPCLTIKLFNFFPNIKLNTIIWLMSVKKWEDIIFIYHLYITGCRDATNSEQPSMYIISCTLREYCMYAWIIYTQNKEICRNWGSLEIDFCLGRNKSLLWQYINVDNECSFYCIECNVQIYNTFILLFWYSFHSGSHLLSVE